MERFFKPSVNVIVEGIKSVASKTGSEKVFVFLAGGFGASPWMFEEVGRMIGVQGLTLSRPGGQTNNIVAVGAALYYLDQFVVGRLVRYTYGTIEAVVFDPSDQEHRKRSHKKYLGITGHLQLDTFTPTLSKRTRVLGTKEFRKKVTLVSRVHPMVCRGSKLPVIRYEGHDKKPLWMDQEDKFKTVSHIPADTPTAPYTVIMSLLGFPLFVQELDLITIYGQTEFKAHLAWTENGVEKRTPVAPMHDDDGDKA